MTAPTFGGKVVEIGRGGYVWMAEFPFSLRVGPAALAPEVFTWSVCDFSGGIIARGAKDTLPEAITAADAWCRTRIQEMREGWGL